MATNYTADANCKGAWLFNTGSGTTVSDVTSAPAHFSCVNSPAWTLSDIPAKSYITYAMRFDSASSQRANAESPTKLDDITAGSFCIWVKFNSFSQLRGLFGKTYYYDGGPENELTTGRWSSGRVGLRQYWGTAERLRLKSVSTNEWMHIVVTWDNTQYATGILIYLNGVVVSTYTQSTDGNSSSRESEASLNFYLAYQSHGEYVDCWVSECAAFDRILSSTEVSDIYDNGLQQSTAPAVTYVVPLINFCMES